MDWKRDMDKVESKGYKGFWVDDEKFKAVLV